MNGEQPKIEIFEPFGAAFELMKKILFQPFDFAKWLVIGFAAFLSGAWGNGFSFRSPKGDWNFRSVSYNNTSISESLPHWFFPLIGVIVVSALVIILVLMWISSRGRFIFTDCVVKNRAAITAPWREYRREGNSFFLFSLALMFLTLLFMAVLVFLILLPMGVFSGGKGIAGLGAGAMFALILVGFVWLVLAIFIAVVSQFMIPVMYRRRCRAREAFFDVSKLVLARPGPIILFVLFGIVLVLALVIVSTLAACMTCCIAAFPYISSVVLLPALVWLLVFKLLFLRQFGPQYDVWATEDSALPAAPIAPPEVPPAPME